MTLSQSLLNSPVIPSMARELGVDEETARSGAAALMPAIVAGLGRSAVGGAGTPGGAQALGGAGGAAGLGGLGGLGSILGGLAGGGGGGGGLLDAVLGSQPTPVHHGNDILGTIFGNKDVSRSVTSEAAATSGLDPSLLKKMLPILVMAAVGYLMHQGQQQGGAGSTGGGLGGGIPGMGGGMGAPGGGLGGILGSIVGGLAGRR